MPTENPSPSSEPLVVARQAMATRFEIAFPGGDPVRVRAAAEEALGEIDRLEGLLSLYRPSSEIARVNARAAVEPVRVSPPVFRLLEHAARLSAETGGAFDITVGPLMRCWGFMGDTGRAPDPVALAEARACVGMDRVELDPARFTVRFARKGVMLDLGAIGKGYAVGVAAEVLREAGVTSALLHGGTSTVYALGHPPDAAGWKVAIAGPEPTDRQHPGGGDLRATFQESTPPPPRGRAEAPPPLAVVTLCDEALSVSAVAGKCFQAGGVTFGHVMDPRTGRPAGDTILAAVVLTDATETDALSTALLTLGRAGLPLLRGVRPKVRALVARPVESGMNVESIGESLGDPGQPAHSS